VYLKIIKRHGVTIFGLWVPESGHTNLMQIAVSNRWRKNWLPVCGGRRVIFCCHGMPVC
jgi:hypothetical protein